MKLEVYKKCFCNRCNKYINYFGGELNEKYYVWRILCYWRYLKRNDECDVSRF